VRRRWRKPACGYELGSTSRRVAATFDDETFRDVRNRALEDGVSVAEQIRQLVEWGLEATRKAPHARAASQR
jgi:hypothetical protein